MSRFFIICLQLSLVLFTVFPAQEKDAVSLYEKGRKAQVIEEYFTAIEFYKSSLSVNPSYINPMKGLAECYYAIDEFDEALTYTGKAKQYNKTDMQLYNLEGMIQIGRKDFEAARKQFEYVLTKEPHNIYARFGLAELDIAAGRNKEAARKFMETLDSMPNNETALVRLVEIFSESGEKQKALDCLELALKYHSDDPKVLYTAGKFHYETGDLKLADFYLKAAIDRKRNFHDARQLLAIVYFTDKKVQEAKSMMAETLNAPNPGQKYLARYCLGIFDEYEGNVEEAVNNYILSLQLKNDDEISRIATENLALGKIGIDNTVRKNLSMYHFREGTLLEEQNNLKQAQTEFRRSLLLDYDSQDARFAYARIFRKSGFPVKYLLELKVLRDVYKTTNKEALDDLELYMMNYYESVSYKWRNDLKPLTGDASLSAEKPQKEEIFDQYAIMQKKYRIALYTEHDKNKLIHPFSDRIILDYFRDMLSGYGNIEPVPGDYMINSFDTAFRTSNEKNADYFLVARIEEKERSFEIFLRICLSRTGSELGNIRMYKTGNRRIQNAVVKSASDFHDLLPQWGTLLTRRYNNGIIDLGTRQGIKKDDELIIIKKDRVKTDLKKIRLVYDDADILGTFRVTATDENLSEGVIKKKNFFDFINPQDEVIFEVKKDK